MKNGIIDEIMSLKEKSLDELKTKYTEIFPGELATSNNRIFIWHKIAYRLQEIEYGGLSIETKNRINELIDRYDPVNNKMIRPQNVHNKNKPNGRDTRLPIPGAIIRKEYKGRLIEVKTLEKGFEFEGKTYKTLSAVAKAITGAHWNGYIFFKP